MKIATDDGLLSTNQLAERWNMHPHTLINWRTQGKGPAFVRNGRRRHGRRPGVRYRIEVIQEYEEKNQWQK